MPELNFDGLVGPTHNYGGLSAGNVASKSHGGKISSPKQAALQGLDKMRVLRTLGVPQAVLPPQPRPDLGFLARLGFSGSDEEMLAKAGAGDGHALRVVSSASAMWAANAATVAPSPDTADGRLHIVPANLQHQLHRSLEAATTTRVLAAIFEDDARFCVHPPLPGGGQLADEGAANHTRLRSPGRAAAHLFVWGRAHFEDALSPERFPARQTLEASRAVARLLQLDADALVFAQQAPAAIDAGAFHADVLCVGNEDVLLVHEAAFVDGEEVLARLQERVPSLQVCVATEAELPLSDAVDAYPFNSQLVSASGHMQIIAPAEVEENPAAAAFLERAAATVDAIEEVRFVPLRHSMRNGGGPACLRLRVQMEDDEMEALRARVLLDDELEAELRAWVNRHYRDRLVAMDLRDPGLHRQQLEALDELTEILRLGSVYEFQRGGAER